MLSYNYSIASLEKNARALMAADWSVLPERTVYFRASCAIMLTRPSNRVVMAEPRSLRKRDSHTRQYCSPLSRLHHGAWNESTRGLVHGEIQE